MNEIPQMKISQLKMFFFISKQLTSDAKHGISIMNEIPKQRALFSDSMLHVHFVVLVAGKRREDLENINDKRFEFWENQL